MFMNQAEIEAAADNSHECPNVRAGYRFLKLLMEATNRQSDGWAYWPKPSQSAQKLQELLKTAGNPMFPTHGTITVRQLQSALVPIKAMVTRERKRQRLYGNTFEFDVEAALTEAKGHAA
jgi:hypothetical protein